MNIAFMIIDLQKAYYQGDAKKFMDAASGTIHTVLPIFRQNGLPVIWVQHHDEEDGAVPGKSGFDLIDSLQPLEGEIRIQKRYGNSFNKTGLWDIVREKKIDTILIAGYCAEYCVLSTYRGALDLDLTPVLLKNGLASSRKENIRFVEEMSNSISCGILKKVLGD